MKTNRRFRSGTNKSGQHTHQMLRLLTAVLAMGMICACQKEESQDFTPPAPEPTAPLTLVPNTDPKVQNDIVLEEETPGVYKILTTGEDPYFCTVPFEENVPPELNVLSFEYQTDRNNDNIQLFFWTEVDGEVIPDVERTIFCTPFEIADTWHPYSVHP